MPSRTLRASSALLLAASLALTGTDVAAAARADLVSRAAPTAQHTSVAAKVDTLDLRGDGVLPHRHGRTARVQKWNVRTLWYYETLPKWDWSLSTAVAKWNASGGRIRLARTIYPSKAQVRIGYGATGSAAGMATLGATRNAWVRLSSRYSTMNALDARNRVMIMHVFAHELGHVLGFRHTTTPCTLMAPVLDVDSCAVVPPTQPGRYKCRTLDTGLVERFVRMYGGTARYPGPTWCLIDPLPPALTGVGFTGGMSAGEPVAIHWTPPTWWPTRARIVLKRWAAATTCGTAPSWADTFRRELSPGIWRDTMPAESEDACFQVQLVNRYGAGRAAQRLKLTRWVPSIVAPVVGTATYNRPAGAFTVPVTAPDGTELSARWNPASPDTCVTEPTGGSAQAFTAEGGVATLAATGAFPRCVSWFAFDSGFARYSSATHVTLAIPAVESPTIGEVTWHPEVPRFSAPASHPAGTHLVIDMNEDPETCQGTYTRGQAVSEFDKQPDDGVAEFLTVYPDQCVSFYAIDDRTGVASDPTQVVVQAPLPTETPIMGPITMLGNNFYPWREAELGAAPGNKVGYEVFAGECPETPPAVERWRTQLQGEMPSGNYAPDAYHANYGLFPSAAAGTNCVVYTSLDWFGWDGPRWDFTRNVGVWLTDRHGPVLMREFVDEGPEPPTVENAVWDAVSETFIVDVSVEDRPIKASYDPVDPLACPTPGQQGARELNVVDWGPPSLRRLTPPTPHTCVTFYIDAGEGFAPLSTGVPIELVVPEG